MARKQIDKLQEIVMLQERMEGYFQSDSASISSIARTWVPSADLYETENSIFLNAELPGVEQSDIKIEAKDNVITIQGQRKLPSGMADDFIMAERCYGPFQRTFRLPSAIAEETVNAEFKTGVLYITMEKAGGPEPKFVQVRLNKDGEK